MRRSSREKKKPQLLFHNNPLPSTRTLDNDEEDPDTESEQASDASDELPAKKKIVVSTYVKPTTKERVVSLPVSKGKTTNSKTTDVQFSSSSNEFSFFELVTNGRKTDAEIKKWIAHFLRNKIGATVAVINFSLKAAGAKQGWISEDVDLEALEPEEIDELLSEMVQTMASSDGAKAYPLAAKQKGRSFREKYSSFWNSLASKLLTLLEDTGKSKRASGAEILRRLIDQLVSFSSMSVMNIRDAVTEAALSIGTGILSSCKELKSQIEVAIRQMAAEEKGSSFAHKKSNPKYTAYQKQKESATKELEVLLDLCNVLFNSVFAHRIKDSSEVVRAICIRHVNEWVLFDVKRDIKVETLKYIGWACSDYSAAVRLAAIHAMEELIQLDHEIVSQLQTFVDHFIPRFIEIACADCEETISFAMISVLRIMQKGGLLDSVSEDKLDLVDAVVFDTAVSKKLRQAALVFFFDHTEGFDSVEDEDQAGIDKSLVSSAANKKKRKKAEALSTEDSKAFQRRQQVSLQLETLTEFAEHHLRGNFEKVEMLADACLLLPNFDILFDWSTMISLLLRESDELISSALRPPQVAILLRMLITSANHVMRLQAANKSSSSSSSAAELANRLSLSKNAVSQSLDHWESLNGNLQKSLPLLLTRFRDDDANLSVLCMLLPMCDYSSAQNQRSLRALVKVVIDIFKASTNRMIAHLIISAIKGWMDLGGTMSVEVEDTAKVLFQSSWDAMLEAAKGLGQAMRGEEYSLKKRRSSRSISTHSSVEKEELFYSMTASLCKLRSFWGLLDCRTLMTDAGPDSIMDELVEAIEVLCTFADTVDLPAYSISHIAAASDSLEHVCISATKDIASIMLVLLSWMNYEAIKIATDIQGSEVPEDRAVEDSGAVEVKRQQLTYLNEAIISVRDKFSDVLCTLMAPRGLDNASVEQESSLFEVCLGRDAFHLAADLRMLFPLKVKEYKNCNELAFSASQALLGCMRKVFEQEGQRKKEVVAESKHVAIRDAAVKYFVSDILFPHMQVLLFDVGNLNRRQAAALVYYVLDDSEVVSEVVRYFLKSLKDSDFVKYLEVQMVALKGMFGELVAKPVQRRLDGDVDQDLQLEEEGLESVDQLAKKLSMSLGIAKLQDAALAAMVNFFKAGLEFGLSARCNFAFVDCLSPYLRLLTNAAVASIADHAALLFKVQCASVAEEIAEAVRMRDDEGVAPERDLGKVADFVERIRGQGQDAPPRRAGKGRVSLPRKKAAAAKGRRKKEEDNVEADEDEEEQEVGRRSTAPRRAKASVTAQRRSNSSATFLDRVDERDDEAEDIDDEEEEVEEVHVERSKAAKRKMKAVPESDDNGSFVEEDLEISHSEGVQFGRSLFQHATQMQSQSQIIATSSHRGNRAPDRDSVHEVRKVQTFATGLDIQDDDDDDNNNNMDVSYNSANSHRVETATYSRKRSLSVSASQPRAVSFDNAPEEVEEEDDEEGEGVQDTQMSAEDYDALADLDNIPSRRRLR